MAAKCKGFFAVFCDIRCVNKIVFK